MYKLKRKFNRVVSIANIQLSDGSRKRVSLTGKPEKSKVAATNLIPETEVTIPAITQQEIKYLVENKLPYWDRFEHIPSPDKDVKNVGNT